MNYRLIEELKAFFTKAAQKGCIVRIPSHNVKGRIVGVGFKPYWTSPADSKLEKLELNIADPAGRIIPFNFWNVIGYSFVSNDCKSISDSGRTGINIHVYNPFAKKDSEPYDKVLVELETIPNK